MVQANIYIYIMSMYVYVRPDSALGSHEMNIDRMIMNQLYPKLLP